MMIKELKEKLINVLDRNYNTKDIDKDLNNIDSIYFKITTSFSSVDLKSIFKYWKLNWEDWVKDWRCEVVNNMMLGVVIFFKPLDSDESFVCKCKNRRFHVFIEDYSDIEIKCPQCNQKYGTEIYNEVGDGLIKEITEFKEIN